MKILLFNKPYNSYPNPSNPCRECILNGDRMCLKMPAVLCLYGGFKQSDTKIFTL